MIDPAMCRPGRLDKLLYVDLPSAEERSEIIKTLTRNVPLGNPHDETQSNNLKTKIGEIVCAKCDGYSGADLAALVREAGVVALKRTLGALDALEEHVGSQAVSEPTEVWVELEDFLGALEKIQPSVSVAQRRRYESLRSKFAGLPVKAGIVENSEKSG